MEKRLLFAVTLSMLVLLLYPVIVAKIYPGKQADITKSYLVPNKEVTKIQAPQLIQEPIQKNAPDNGRIASLGTEKYTLEISNIGGSISKIIIHDKKINDLPLVDKALYEAGVLSVDGKGILSGASSQEFIVENSGKSLHTEYKNLKLEKNITISHDAYSADASIKITNFSGQAQALSFDITTSSNISNRELYESRYIEAEILYKDGSIKRINSRNLLNYNRIYKNNIEWLALKNKYYTIIAKPLFDPKGVFIKNVSGLPIIGFIVEGDNVYSQESKSYDIHFYIGPMDMKELEKTDPGFTKVIHFGFLTSIGLVLLSTLHFLYSIFHNYGIAIVSLTCIMSMVLYPLTFKSLRSMHKLQEIQPHVEKLRIEYKDNPAKLNKEIMELYRRYNVNPMSGCLPMIVQMPIFIALYSTLSRSIELKNAQFLWIKDLSMPDAFLRISGFTINLLPILMICAMIFQQKISQMQVKSMQTEQQRLMAHIMPFMFGVIFYGLPSGLVLYWLTSTVITSTLQFIVVRKIT